MHTKAKSSTMLTLKSSDIRPAYKKQVNFDHPHKTMSTYLHIKNKSFSARTKKQFNRDPRTKNKSVLIHTWKPNDYLPEHNQIIFDPVHEKANIDGYTENKSIWPLL